MASRDFNEWLNTFTDSVATWGYYTDFEKVYKKAGSIKRELNLLNSLIGVDGDKIKDEFLDLVAEYPKVLKCIPILLAKRESEIIIKSTEKDYYFNFNNMNYEPEEYALFMEKNGLFELISKHLVNNLYDYVTGVEVGLDTNARKNRTGHAMEDLVESYIKEAGFKKDITYFKEMYKSEVEERWGLDLSAISNEGKTEKRFDYVIKTSNQVYAIECNFYGSGGSKLNETARSYKALTMESEDIKGFTFVWFTDGKGWESAKNNLLETFDILPTLYNIQDLKDGIMKKIFK